MPELRWFPKNDQMADRRGTRTRQGAVPWLADAVNTGFPPGSSLNVDAVVVDNGVANVALAPGSAGDAAHRSLAGEQLRLTLTQLPTVSSVVTTVGTLPLAGDDSAAPQPAPLPDERAAVIAGGRLGMWDGTEVKVTPADVGVVPAGATGLALSYDTKTVAMVVDGSVVTSTALSDAPVLEAPPDTPDAPGGPVIPTKTIVEGSNLVAPSFDPARMAVDYGDAFRRHDHGGRARWGGLATPGTAPERPDDTGARGLARRSEGGRAESREWGAVA